MMTNMKKFTYMFIIELLTNHVINLCKQWTLYRKQFLLYKPIEKKYSHNIFQFQ